MCVHFSSPLLRVLTACILDTFTAVMMEAYVNTVYRRASGCAVVVFLPLLFCFLRITSTFIAQFSHERDLTKEKEPLR